MSAVFSGMGESKKSDLKKRRPILRNHPQPRRTSPLTSGYPSTPCRLVEPDSVSPDSTTFITKGAHTAPTPMLTNPDRLPLSGTLRADTLRADTLRADTLRAIHHITTPGIPEVEVSATKTTATKSTAVIWIDGAFTVGDFVDKVVDLCVYFSHMADD